MKKQQSTGIVILLAAILVCLLSLSGCSPAGSGKAAEWESGAKLFAAHFIDVGQADSILLRFPDGKTGLIDGGNNDDYETIAAYLEARGVSKLDFVVATHPHEDHIGAMDDIIRKFAPEAIYAPAATANTKTFENFLLAVKDSGRKITKAQAGVSIPVGEGCTATFLAPAGTSYRALNNYSAVLRVAYGDTEFLFAGDAEKQSEGEMLQARAPELAADVLKVGHHGSDTSSTSGFLAAVNPSLAVISVGEGNDYGLPAPEVVERLESAGIEIYRTDRQGTVVVTTDGEIIKTATEK